MHIYLFWGSFWLDTQALSASLTCMFAFHLQLLRDGLLCCTTETTREGGMQMAQMVLLPFISWHSQIFPAWAFYASIICQNTSAFSLQSALRKCFPLFLVERQREGALLPWPFLESYLRASLFPLELTRTEILQCARPLYLALSLFFASFLHSFLWFQLTWDCFIDGGAKVSGDVDQTPQKEFHPSLLASFCYYFCSCINKHVAHDTNKIYISFFLLAWWNCYFYWQHFYRSYY